MRQIAVGGIPAENPRIGQTVGSMQAASQLRSVGISDRLYLRYGAYLERRQPLEERVNGLETARREALSVDRSRLVTMGEQGRAWMERDFSWQRIAAEFEQAYRWVIADGSPPGFVMVS